MIDYTRLLPVKETEKLPLSSLGPYGLLTQGTNMITQGLLPLKEAEKLPLSSLGPYGLPTQGSMALWSPMVPHDTHIIILNQLFEVHALEIIAAIP